MVTPDPQDRSSQDKHIELVNIIGNPGAGMLTRAMAKQLSNASAHVCLFVDFLSEEEPKKVSKALKHPGWVDAMQDTRTLTMLDATWTCASQLLGGKLVCWSAKKKQSVAMSSAKAEYVAAARCCANILWMKNHVLKGDIELYFIPTQYQLADIFTKHCLKKTEASALSSKTEQTFIFVAFAGRLMMIKIIIICSAWHNTKPEPSSAFSNINLKTSSPEITPKEEHVTLDKPKSPTPFVPASQADFTFDEITFTTNNVVELLYPLHPKQDYFEVVSDFIYKCYLKEAFTRAPNQYKEYLSKVWYTAKTLDDSKVWISSPIGGVRGEIGITTFRNALRAQYLPHSSMYVSPPSITIVRPWFATIRNRGEIGSKETIKKSCLPSRWRLLMAQIMHYLGGKIGGLDQISNKDATILYCLANGVQVYYAKIIWEDLIHKLNKKTRENIVPYPRFLSLLLEHMMHEYENEELTINLTYVFSVHNLTLKLNQPVKSPFTDHMKAICKTFLTN
ncbi:hypothetical protein Tco_1119365 [Tanacetum coccineum]